MDIILNGKSYSIERNFTVQKLLKKLEEEWAIEPVSYTHLTLPTKLEV